MLERVASQHLRGRPFHVGNHDIDAAVDGFLDPRHRICCSESGHAPALRQEVCNEDHWTGHFGERLGHPPHEKDGHQARVETPWADQDGIELAYRVIFSDAIEASDSQLADAARAVIERMKATVRISDLRSLDAEKLRADGEELVALLQSAAPKIGLSKPTLEEGSQ